MVNKLPFARDGVFYAVAVAAIVGTLLTGTVTLSQASAISAVYVAYVLAGVFHSHSSHILNDSTRPYILVIVQIKNRHL